MKTAAEWLMEVSPVFGKEAQLKNIRRIQADALAQAADICMKVQRAEPSNDCEDCCKAILAEADKLEL